MTARDFALSERTALDRFFTRVEFTDTCWLWTGSQSHNGYGQFYVDERSSFVAHRWLYKRVVGDVPDELQLDHLCRVRLCVNWNHLEPVTAWENVRRSDSGINMRTRTHCPQQHPYDEANTKINVRARGVIQRNCRICLRDAARRYRERRRSAAA